MSQPVETIVPKRWDGAAWVPEPLAADASAAQQPPPRLRLATLNILADCFPWFVTLATPPAERIAAAVDSIVKCDADVLGLNEVTPGILATLLGDDRLRAAYRTTHGPGDIAKGVKHCCVVLSKVPLQGAWHFPAVTEVVLDKAGEPVKFGQQRLPVVVRVRGVDVCSLHTMAYQKGETRRLRAEQIASISSALRAQGRPFVIMGDMNLHDPAEDGVIFGNDLLDVWAETHPDGVRAVDPNFKEEHAGYTFDARVNTMIPRYIPGETRRMRLDRILVSRGFPMMPAGPCRMWANEPVDAKRDVFISDHFGLVIDMVAHSDDTLDQPAVAAGWGGSEVARVLLLANASSDPDAAHKVGIVKRSLSFAGHGFWLAKRGTGFA